VLSDASRISSSLVPTSVVRFGLVLLAGTEPVFRVSVHTILVGRSSENRPALVDPQKACTYNPERYLTG